MVIFSQAFNATYARHIDEIRVDNCDVTLDYYIKTTIDELYIKKGSTVADLRICVPYAPLAVQREAIVHIAKLTVQDSLELKGNITPEILNQIPTTEGIILEVFRVIDFQIDGVEKITGVQFPKFRAKRVLISDSQLKGIKFQEIEGLEELELKYEEEKNVLEFEQILELFPKSCREPGARKLLQSGWFGSELKKYEDAPFQSTLIDAKGYKAVIRPMSKSIQIDVRKIKETLFSDSKATTLILHFNEMSIAELKIEWSALRQLVKLNTCYIVDTKSEDHPAIGKAIQDLQLEANPTVRFVKAVHFEGADVKYDELP